MTLNKNPLPESRYLLTPLDETPYTYTAGQEWGRASLFSCDSLPDDVEAFGIVADIQNDSAVSNCILVIELHDAETDSIVLWHGTKADDGHFAAGDNVVANAIIFSDELSPKGKTVKTYLWNQGKSPLTMKRMSYYFTRRSPVLTGLYEPLN